MDDSRGSYEPAFLEHIPDDGLETRQRGSFSGGGFIRGGFRYGQLATIRDRGKIRKEQITQGAFDFTVEDEEQRIELLTGHSFNKPIASRSAGSLRLWNRGNMLHFEAALPPIDNQPTWMRDAVKGIAAGLFQGISPGFRVPPKSVVPGAVTYAEDPEADGVLIRQINDAVLYELSLVTRPAYLETVLEIGVGEDEPYDETIDDATIGEVENPDGNRSEPLALELERKARLWLYS